MAVDMFLKLDGVSGESADSKHKNEIEILSFSWGVEQQGTVSPRQGGKVSINDFHFVHKFDKATPALMLSCATGKHIPTGLLTVRKAGKEQVEYLKIKLTDCIISSFQTGGSGHIAPSESFSINFTNVQVNYLGTLVDIANEEQSSP